MKNKDIIISAGHKNFHMLFTASEMEKRGRLSQVLCGAYPTAFEQSVLNKWPFKLSKKLNRFVNRAEKFPVEKVRQSRKSEMLSSLSSILDKLGFDREALNVFAFKMYGKLAENYVREAAKNGATIYHYRAGFGQSSVKVAKELGMKTICDHSIVHPSLLNLMIELKGNYPESIPSRPNGIWGAVLDDIEVADHVVVNSDFVAETFEFMGFDPAKLSVVYLGVEDKFIHSLPAARDYYQLEQIRPIKFLFAGGIIPRKGVDEISAALQQLTSTKIELHLAGSLPDVSRSRYENLLADARVTYHGMLSQKELAKLMSESDVFLFPSRAEGSARVIFEAMAAGCAVICTHNAGSAVQDDVGGKIIPINDQESLIKVLEDVLKRTEKYVGFGKSNKQSILDYYRQKNYGDGMERVYE
ncbi:glycosyltransferase family 4 protein [Neptunomonas sp.]|uniref:glycosyltransferase family 4 protein n=1 Tax=Neptunomonas sp. TaxID=1971898 RepID=UPI0035671F10